MQNIDDQHLSWAAKVIDLITPQAEKFDKAFYALQSPLKQNPKVLFLGLNPGGGHSYKSQCENPDWEFHADEKNNKKMQPKRLLKGNPTFDKDAAEWKLIKGLKKIDLFRDAVENDDFVLANFYYLSTADFNEAESHIEVMQMCKTLTYELINLIQPKLIIVLGTAKGIDLLQEFRNKKTLLQGYHQRLLIAAEYENCKVLAIPHPSLMAINDKEVVALNTNIKEYLANKSLTEFPEIAKVDSASFSTERLNSLLAENNIDIHFSGSVDKKFFDAVISNDNNELLLRINPKDKTLGIRDNMAATSGASDRFYANVQNIDKLLDAVTDDKLQKTNSWMIQKHFSSYPFSTLEELYDVIVKDIAAFYETFTNPT